MVVLKALQTFQNHHPDLITKALYLSKKDRLVLWSAKPIATIKAWNRKNGTLHSVRVSPSDDTTSSYAEVYKTSEKIEGMLRISRE